MYYYFFLTLILSDKKGCHSTRSITPFDKMKITDASSTGCELCTLTKKKTDRKLAFLPYPTMIAILAVLPNPKILTSHGS